MSKKEKGKKKASVEQWDTEDVVQAVVIADSFNFRFLPVTLEKPRALLPLVNRPLIDYTVEFLAVAGVQEIFVFCCAHAELIKCHLEASRWMKPTSPVKVHIIISEDCPSVGDALREIDSRSLIRSDFILVSGDLVSNMELKEVMECHQEARKRDKMLIMTCVYKKANPNHRTRSHEDDILIATSSIDGRLLYCEKPKGKKKMLLPVSIFEENTEVDLHYDVLDCHVSICAPTVPQLFSDNFDYQSRHHFIRGILVNEEILGNHIYTHFISDQYAARVSNFRTYDAVSKDVMHRWVYPLVPDNAMEETYSYGRHNIYLNTNVSLALGSILHEDVVIGAGSSVKANTEISHSSIGRHCQIGQNVRIEGSYIWDDVVVGDNCVIQQAVVCDGVTIKEGVRIEPGCVLSYGVVVGPEFTLKSGSRLTMRQHLEAQPDDWEEEDEEEVERPPLSKTPESVAEEVGSEGRGFLWRSPPRDEDGESDASFVEKWPFGNESVCSSTVTAASSPSTSPDPGALLLDGGDADAVMFYNEILDSIRSGVAELVPNDNTILMINASRYAYNIPNQEVPLVIVRAILEGPQHTTGGQSSDLLLYVKNTVGHFESLLHHYIKGLEIQVNVMHTLAECAVEHQNIMSIFAKVILLLYNADIVEETAIMQWYSKFEGTESPAKKQVEASIRPVIEWLRNAEEESSEDED